MSSAVRLATCRTAYHSEMLVRHFFCWLAAHFSIATRRYWRCRRCWVTNFFQCCQNFFLRLWAVHCDWWYPLRQAHFCFNFLLPHIVMPMTKPKAQVWILPL